MVWENDNKLDETFRFEHFSGFCMNFSDQGNEP